ncbi:Eos1 protein [Saccharomycopsis crataegensis]|uniref:Eos1 protein n=1 Tax=Saccharomycopsis crataegensis TaxID=43959 RepID=A0AAV5QKP1_9ASCO|nr:Eos1 protein [Saccharomycopsis crataegensis]
MGSNNPDPHDMDHQLRSSGSSEETIISSQRIGDSSSTSEYSTIPTFYATTGNSGTARQEIPLQQIGGEIVRPSTPERNDIGDDYANHPPPIPLPSSPSYSHYLQAVEAAPLLDVEYSGMEIEDILRRPSNFGQTLDNNNNNDNMALDTSTDHLSANYPTIRRNGSNLTFDNAGHFDRRTSSSSSSSTSSPTTTINLSQRSARRSSSHHHNHHRRRSSSGSIIDPDNDEGTNGKGPDETPNDSMKALKAMVFSFLNPKQHLALAFCRDLPLWLCLYYMAQYFYESYDIQWGTGGTVNYEESVSMLVKQGGLSMDHEIMARNAIVLANMLSTRSSEYLITGMWCFVSSFMVYCVLDGLIVRWIVVYSVPAAIVRVLSMSVLLITIIRVTLVICCPSDAYLLHTWIFISCILTLTYIIQNFFVHDLNEKIVNDSKKRRGSHHHIPNVSYPDNEEVDDDNNDNYDDDDDDDYDSDDELDADAAVERKILRGTKKNILANILNGNIRVAGSSRYFNYYNIVIYAVMPIGVASFLTMIVLLRNILILKVDVETIYRSN